MTWRSHQKLSHVKANAACTNQRHTLAHAVLAQQHVDVAQHTGQVLTWNTRVARLHARSQNHLVKLLGQQVGGIDPGVQVQLDTHACNALAKVTQRFFKLLLARHAFGEVELPANHAG